jgi:lipoate-protein ligase A
LKSEYAFRFAFTPDWYGFDNMSADRFFGEIHPPDVPFIRLYTWDRPTISHGCNQNAARRLDIELCQKEEIPVVKRPTGGRELLHGHDLCYCAIIPRDGRITGVEAKAVFSDINEVLISALKGMGVDARWSAFQSRPKLLDGPCFVQADSGEITVNGRKLVASAQRVYERAVIQEGSIPLVRPTVDITRYLRGANGDAMRRRICEVTAVLFEELAESRTLAEVVRDFEKGFENFYGTPAATFADLLKAFSGHIGTYPGTSRMVEAPFL